MSSSRYLDCGQNTLATTTPISTRTQDDGRRVHEDLTLSLFDDLSLYQDQVEPISRGASDNTKELFNSSQPPERRHPSASTPFGPHAHSTRKFGQCTLSGGAFGYNTR